MKVGIFGGTFDPVHSGHLLLAEFVKDEINLDEIWFIPAHHHIFKSEDQINSPEHRSNMLQLALQNNPEFKLMDIEIKRSQISYTVDSLKEFKSRFPEYNFFFIMGADNVNDFSKWKRPEEIVTLCTLVLLSRPNFNIQNEQKRYFENSLVVHSPLLEISSSEIRNRIKNGLSIRYMVPDNVLEYIYSHKLYI